MAVIRNIINPPCHPPKDTSRDNSYYPYFESRNNFKYATGLSTGAWIEGRCSTKRAIELSSHCKRFGIPFKAAPLSTENVIGMRIALILNLFYKKITDRFGEDTGKGTSKAGDRIASMTEGN